MSFVIGEKVKAPDGTTGIVLNADVHDEVCWHYLIRWRDESESWMVGGDLRLARRAHVA